MTAQPVLLSTASWSIQQEFAIHAVREWLADPNGPQVFRVFGYAGTGKTTLARELAQTVKGTVLFGTFTGKAALVLRSKGCDDASTLHSLLYKPKQDPITGEVTFNLNDDSPLTSCALLVVDEVSMVDEKMAKDILSFRSRGKPIRVLVLGDPAQLPPVNGTGFFINAKPDVMLTEVHRQARDNPIIWLSMQVREGKPLKPGKYGDSELIDRKNCDRLTVWSQVTAADQLICGLNKTRAHSNQKIRREAGLVEEGHPKEWLPVMGDRVICLKNQRDTGLLNGMLFDVLESEETFRVREKKRLHLAGMRVKSLDQLERAPLDVKTPRQFFEGKESDLHWKELIGLQQFTFGWAITVHKAQGSQWPHVGIIDESEVFREHARNHLYTALTRAADRVTMVL